MNKLNKTNKIISIVFIIDYLMILLTSFGIFKNFSFMKYFYLASISLIPAILIGLLLESHKKENNYSLNEYSQYIPVLFETLVILTTGIKMSMQLNKSIVFEIITVMVGFILLEATITFIYRDKKINMKNKIIYQIITILVMILFLLIMSMLAFDVFYE